MKRITYVREYEETIVETYVADVPDDLLAAANEDSETGGPNADALDDYVTDNFSPDYEDRLGMVEESLNARWGTPHLHRGEEPEINVRRHCPECGLVTDVPLRYSVYVEWMDRTPIEELIDDEDTIEVITTGRCEMHRATKGEQG